VKQHFAPEEIKGLRNPGRTAPARMRRIGPQTDPSGPPGEVGGAGEAAGPPIQVDPDHPVPAENAPPAAVAGRGARPQGGRRIVDRPGPVGGDGSSASGPPTGGSGPSAALGAGWLKQLALAGAAQARPGPAHSPPPPVGSGLPRR
jgi:hypothetical protein